MTIASFNRDSEEVWSICYWMRIKISDFSSSDPYLSELLKGYTDAEISELQRYLLERGIEVWHKLKTS